MSALLYQSRSPYRIWVAIIVSALLHAAAVAFAELRRPSSALELPGTPGDSTITVTYEPEDSVSSPPLDSADSPPLPPVDQPIFQDKTPAPPPSHQRALAIGSIGKAPASRIASPSHVASGKVFAVSAPRPEYPYEARRGRITGEGIASLAIDSASGRVLSVVMTKSTGNTLLDQAAIAGFRRWRFRPGAPAAVRCPITYTLTGAMF